MVKKNEIFVTGVQDQYRVIFPTPQFEEYPDGEYALKEKYDTSVHHAFCMANKGGNADIKISVDSSLEGEEHKITVDSEGIKIEYATDEGLYRALTSVRQLIIYGEGKTVPFANIHDKPQFKYRGYELCRTRNRMTMKYLKRIADFLCELRYNVIEIWMENGPEGFVYEKFPEIETNPDDLTAEDMREFDEYCKERHIQVMLDTNCFGHLNRWFDLEQYKHLEVRDENTRTHSLNILHPEARDFVLKLFDSYIPNTSCELVSVGLDEAFGLGKFQLEEICKEKGREQVLMDYSNEIIELVRERYGKRSFVCTDMFNEMHPEESKKYLSQLPKDIVTREWGYEQMNIQLVEAFCRMKHDLGLEFVAVTCTHSWASFAGRFNLAVDNMRSYAEVAQKYNGYGYVVSIWNGEAYAWDLVPAAIGAQYAWNVGHHQHGGWTKGYYVRNAQNYIDKYVFGGAKASRDICRLANTYLLEPEYVACGTILRQMIEKPLSETIRKEFYDVTELYDEFCIDNIIEYVTKLVNRLEKVDFPKVYKDEVLNDSKALILAAEYMRVRITGKVTKEMAEKMHKMSDEVIAGYKAFKEEQGYVATEHIRVPFFEARATELDDFIVD